MVPQSRISRITKNLKGSRNASEHSLGSVKIHRTEKVEPTVVISHHILSHPFSSHMIISHLISSYIIISSFVLPHHNFKSLLFAALAIWYFVSLNRFNLKNRIRFNFQNCQITLCAFDCILYFVSGLSVLIYMHLNTNIHASIRTDRHTHRHTHTSPVTHTHSYVT